MKLSFAHCRAAAALICLLCSATLAAGAINPFDLSHRAGQTVAGQAPAQPQAALPAPTDSTAQARPAANSANNPFDLMRGTAKSNASTKPGPSAQAPKRPAPAHRFFVPTQSLLPAPYLLGVIILIIVWLTVAVSLYRPYLQKLAQAFVNANLLGQLQREFTPFNYPRHLLFYAHYVLVAALFVQLLGRYNGFAFSSQPWLGYAICLGIVAGAAGLKHLVLAFIGAVFPLGKEASLYAFTIAIFNHMLGLILLPILLLAAFAPEEMRQAALYIGAGMALFVYVFRAVRGAIIGANFLIANKFQFLTYLCSVEIAPVIILLKAIGG